MDLGIIIIGIVVLLLSFSPFIFIAINKKSKTKKMNRALTSVALENGCNISQQEMCGDFMIGVDEAKKYAFFVKREDGRMASQFVNLDQFQECQMANIGRPIGRDSTYKLVDRLELNFIPKENGATPSQFELYDVEKRGQLGGELQCAEKWVKIIGHCMKKK